MKKKIKDWINDFWTDPLYYTADWLSVFLLFIITYGLVYNFIFNILFK